MQSEFVPTKCWHNYCCDKYETENCKSTCVEYAELEYLFKHSGLPEKQQYRQSLNIPKVDDAAYARLNSIKNNISEFVDFGDNLYIYGQGCGNGKTGWAIKLLQVYFDAIWNGNWLQPNGLFISTTAFLNAAKRSINYPSSEYSEQCKLLKRVPLVIWDDIGGGIVTQFEEGLLLEFIDYRCLAGLSNIYTGNFNGEELIKNIGTRLTSRIWNGSARVELVGPDWRDVDRW